MLNLADLPMPDLKLVRHKSIRSILTQFWHLDDEGLAWEEFLQCPWTEGEDDASPMKAADMVKSVRQMGFWGYASKQDKTVHVWVGKRADRAAVLYFLGHEIGHCLGRQSRDHMAEERRADSYGQAAALSAKWLDELSA